MHEKGCSVWRHRRSLYLAFCGGLLVVVTATLSFAQSPADDDTTSTASPDANVDDLFADFLHYARLGRFTAADAFAKQLLAHPKLDPKRILELAQRDKDSVNTLLILIKNSSIGDSAAHVLELIHAGEHEKRKDSDRIRDNIENLARGPQQEFFGQRALAESGEYAVPHMVQTLLDESKSDLRTRVATALTRMGRQAVTPMAIAMQARSNDLRMHIIRALGDIGYTHAIPYLLQAANDDNATNEIREAATGAVAKIAARTGLALGGTAADHFVALAERYYRGDDAVSADPALASANVWYWNDDDQRLWAVEVPEKIFGQVMAMRCCELALLLQSDRADAIALWLAANTQRESRLAMDVESGDPDEIAEADATRPDVFPRALYFTQAAGPRYAHLMLARAVKDRDTAVALGAIEALRVTAGEASLIGAEDYKQPLVQALQFPDLIVRIRAALALGAALPKSPFAGDQHVVLQLAAAVTLSGEEHVVVVDPDEANLNRVMEALRSIGLSVLGDTDFYRALERGRSTVQSLRGLFLASNMANPTLPEGLRQMRREYLFSKIPVVVLSRPTDKLTVDDLMARDANLEPVEANADEASLVDAFSRVRGRSGLADPGSDMALAIALEAVDTLHGIAADGRTVYRVEEAEPALQAALGSTEEPLQTAAAGVLALLRTPSAQRGIATVALHDAASGTLRVAAFKALAASAKRNGNLLESDQIATLVEIAREEPDLTLRTAASLALGALNLDTNKASEIIRSYHKG